MYLHNGVYISTMFVYLISFNEKWQDYKGYEIKVTVVILIKNR